MWWRAQVSSHSTQRHALSSSTRLRYCRSSRYGDVKLRSRYKPESGYTVVTRLSTERSLHLSNADGKFHFPHTQHSDMHSLQQRICVISDAVDRMILNFAHVTPSGVRLHSCHTFFDEMITETMPGCWGTIDFFFFWFFFFFWLVGFVTTHEFPTCGQVCSDWTAPADRSASTVESQTVRVPRRRRPSHAAH